MAHYPTPLKNQVYKHHIIEGLDDFSLKNWVQISLTYYLSHLTQIIHTIGDC